MVVVVVVGCATGVKDGSRTRVFGQWRTPLLDNAEGESGQKMLRICRGCREGGVGVSCEVERQHGRTCEGHHLGIVVAVGAVA